MKPSTAWQSNISATFLSETRPKVAIVNTILAIASALFFTQAVSAGEHERKAEIVWTELDGQQKIGVGVGAAGVNQPRELPVFLYVVVKGDRPPSVPFDKCVVKVDTTKLPKGDTPNVVFSIPENPAWKATDVPRTFRVHLRSLKLSRTGKWGVSIVLPESAGAHKTQTLYFDVTE